MIGLIVLAIIVIIVISALGYDNGVLNVPKDVVKVI
jgi:hypothetical protein